jgi:peptidylprolyl isomerase
MKRLPLFTPALVLAAVAAPLALAQTSAHTTHVAAHPMHHGAAGACVLLPEISPKVPAVPAGSPCAKSLYTLTTEPTVKLSDVAGVVPETDLRRTLGLESNTFSLDYIDTKIGTGEIARPGYWYTIHYTGYLLDGSKFDSSVDRGEPITIHYGEHQVIPGWDTGFFGMRVGGKRRLIIPFELAYGANGHPPVIPGKATLVFDVELISQSATEPKKPEPKPVHTAKPAPMPPAAAKPAAPATATPATATPATATPVPAPAPKK